MKKPPHRFAQDKVRDTVKCVSIPSADSLTPGIRPDGRVFWRPHLRARQTRCPWASCEFRKVTGSALDKVWAGWRHWGMVHNPDTPLDFLWKEYGQVFRGFDDLSLARWLAQTLGQLEGRVWRLSHPLVGAYRLGAQAGHDRQIWHKRLATPPHAYTESPCCRAPFLPLLTRDVRNAGLFCQHCNEILVPFDEIPPPLRQDLEDWANQYGPVHEVSHWTEAQQKACGDYDREFDHAGEMAEQLLAYAGLKLAPRFLEYCPAVVWEDQDECLEVRPEDLPMS